MTKNGKLPDGSTVPLTNQTEASLCAEPGDSGGPVYWANSGHGVMSLSALDANKKCLSTPRASFNVLSDIERELGVRVFENPFGL